MADTKISVKVVPKAAKTESAGVMADGTRKIRVAAVPENGKANEALRRFLADEYGVTLNQVEIIAGHTGTRKTVRVRDH
jgi:uncharacterized protein (TIGR00251 family)